MVEYLELFKGDDTDFSLNQAICIKLVTDYDLAGCTAHVKFYDYEQIFYPIVDKKLPLSFPGSVTSKFPLGRGSAKIWLTEPDPKGSGTRRRTIANDLKILVTNNIDLLSRKDISYTMLNGKVIRKDDDISITVDDATGNWELDKDYPQPEMSAMPYFEYVEDKRPGKSGYIWRMTSAYGGTSYLWYGPTDANAIVGDFDTGIAGIPTYTASRIKRVEARATQSSLVSPNEKRLATMAAVRKVIQSTLADVEKKKDKTDLWIYEVENENWIFSGGPEEFLAIANEIGAEKPYYYNSSWRLPNFGRFTFDPDGYVTNKDALVLNGYYYLDTKTGNRFSVTVSRGSAVSTEPVLVEKINAMATRIAKNLIKFAIKDLNPTTSTVNELITALQTIYA